MALSFSIDSDESSSLDEYIEYVSRNVDLSDLDSVVASAPRFRALLNNRTLLTDALNDQLLDWSTFQTGNTYTAQTFMLGYGKGFFIRVNIWKPPSQIAEVRAAEAQNFYYLVPHDHNFTFMTGGYIGPGYWTNIWEYDRAALNGTRGQKVDLQFLERTSLPTNKIMIYRKSIDIHSQEHAEEFSVSLNLMLLPEGETADRPDQIIFDTENGTVQSILSSSSGRVTICDLAQHVGDDRTRELLDALSRRHEDPHVRAACMRSLLRLEPNAADAIFTRATQDRNEQIRRMGAVGSETRVFPESLYEASTVDPHAVFETGPGSRTFQTR